MELIINEDNMSLNDIEEFNFKARAILVDENNKILIANYGKIILLPGGKVDENEIVYDAITRELREELGQNYTKEELDYMITLNYYQKNYPKRDGTLKSRAVQTYYFVGRYKGVSTIKQNLTEKEQKDNFKLELISLDKLENMILTNKNDNPRNAYFQKELLTVLNFYKSKYPNLTQTKTKLKI